MLGELGFWPDFVEAQGSLINCMCLRVMTP